MRNVNQFKLLGFEFFLFYGLIISVLTPYIYNYYLIIPTIISAILLVILLLHNPKFFLHKKYVALIATYSLVILFYKMSGISTAATGNYVSYFIKVSVIIISLYFMDYSSDKEKKYLFSFTIVVLVINAISSIHVYKMYPNLLVSLINSNYYGAGFYGKLNVGSTSFVYCLLFASLFLFRNILNSKNRKSMFSTLLTLLTFMFFSYYILAYGKSTTVIAFYFISLLLIIMFKNPNSEQTLFGFLILILIAVLFLFFGNNVLDRIANLFLNISGEKAYNRIIAIKDFIFANSDSNGSIYLSRIDLIKLDIRFWLKNPLTFLFGNGYHTYASSVNSTDVIANASINLSGGHSGLIDILAKYGLLGFSVILMIIKNLYQYCKKNVDFKTKKFLIIIFIIFIINSIINDVFCYDILLVIFCFHSFICTEQKLKRHVFKKNDEVYC